MKGILNRVPGLSSILVGIILSVARAQWPADPDVNLALCDYSGAQTITKIVPASDGGCYVSWWGSTLGNYAMYLQRLNGNGEIQWQENGLLISNHPQETWLTDYDLAVDSADYAIIALNDIRAGGDWDIYGYRISPTGEFAWGANGLTISENAGFEPDPQVLVTTAGNIVFAWQEDDVIHIRKVTSEGADFWDPATITLTSTYPLSITRLAQADNDCFILQFLVAQGPNYYDPKHLYAHKFDADGNELWGSSGVAVTTAGGFGPQMRPEIVTDSRDGAYSYWYDSRNNVLHAYAQHISSNGAMLWTANGVIVSTNVNELQMSPSLVTHPQSGDVMLFYENTDYNQTVIGVYGQRIDSTGARQWGNAGRALVPMSNQARLLVRACPLEDGAVVTYLENFPGSVVNSSVNAVRVDAFGNPAWDPSPIFMSTVVSGKGYLATCVNHRGQVISTWQDNRSDPDGDVYLQNINPDGSFGSIGPPPCSYIPGDINGNGDANGVDVTYGVNYFKGFGPQPPDTCDCPPHGEMFVSGDVNSNCEFNGVDITYFVNYLKGIGPELLYCPDCPPGR